jgi:tRNA(Ile)-lysidine synthase
MRDLLARVARTLRRDCQIGAGDRVALAVSGGSDSVAMLFLVRALAPDLGFDLAGILHLNHRLRGAQSDEDEAFVRQLAARLGLPVAVGAVDVAADARARRISIETAARDARYTFFARAAADVGATLVATGHTLDDQAETVLLRLLRGAGTRGLSGIRARRGAIIRPILHVRRAETRAYLVARDEPWREDASNADRSILRNRIRHEVLPVLTSVAPGGARALARLAALAHDDEMFLMEAAIKNLPALVVSEEGADVDVSEAKLDSKGLSLLPVAVGRRVIRAMAAQVAPDASLSAAHVEAVLALAATDKPAGHLDLPGLVVERRGAGLTFTRPVDPSGTAGGSPVWPARALELPGIVRVPEAGLTIRAHAGSGTDGEWTRLGAGAAAIQLQSIRLPLFVRNRRPGDRFRPLGAPGRRKLQDVFVDRKVPRAERDRVPLIVDADDRIVWVAGLVVAHDCRVTAPEAGVLILEKRKAE